MNKNWKHAGAVRCIVLSAAFMFLVMAGCSNPVWYIDHNYGIKLAEKDKKPMLFYFKEWDSTQHRNMQLQVFENAEVKKELLDTVNIELEFAWSDPYRKIYGVQKPQVCVMTDSEGNKVGSGLYVNPVPTAPRFLEWLRDAKVQAKAAIQQPGTASKK